MTYTCLSSLESSFLKEGNFILPYNIHVMFTSWTPSPVPVCRSTRLSPWSVRPPDGGLGWTTDTVHREWSILSRTTILSPTLRDHPSQGVETHYNTLPLSMTLIRDTPFLSNWMSQSSLFSESRQFGQGHKLTRSMSEVP